MRRNTRPGACIGAIRVFKALVMKILASIYTIEWSWRGGTKIK